MKKECHIVHSTSRDTTNHSIIEYAILNCFETIEQAKASLQYEYDLYMKEHADLDDPDDRPVWLDEDHTELKVPSTAYYDVETILYIDSTVDYNDKNEPLMKYCG